MIPQIAKLIVKRYAITALSEQTYIFQPVDDKITFRKMNEDVEDLNEDVYCSIAVTVAKYM